MAKRIPIDCKRITEQHLRGLTEAELCAIVERIETQSLALNRASRMVARALDELARDA